MRTTRLREYPAARPLRLSVYVRVSTRVQHSLHRSFSLCVHPHPRTITRSKGLCAYGGKSVKRRTRTDPYGEDRVGDGIGGGGDGGGGGGGG